MGKRLLRRSSMSELGARRAAIASRLRARGFELAFVNGGGTGSLELTLPATGVSEVSAGSGLYKPLLFDGYRSLFVRSLEPACFFALEVTRRPASGIVTCLGGGYVASGAAGADRLPRPHAPAGLALLPMEGAGEVQTPVSGDAADALDIGAPVFFRHAKAGELMERFNEVLLVQDGRVVERAPTYRGQGWCFL
jgi:D-serine deaminase-like pyridoxal phosphate-dependent protein